MKIIFTGLPYFARKIVKDLRDYDSSNQFLFFNTYYSKIDQLKFLFNVKSADLVVSFNGAYSKSKALDLALKHNKKIMMQWHGTDVLKANELYNLGKLERKYIDNSQSFTDAEWLQSELKNIGTASEILHFKYVEKKPLVAQFKDSDVICYIAQDKEEFYGINEIVKLAERFKDIRFHIIGTDGGNYQSIKNIHFYGWVNQQKVKDLLNQHAIFIRLTEHDGFSLSVLDALNNGNEVIWNYPFKGCNFVGCDKDLFPIFEAVQKRVKDNLLYPNKENIAWMGSHFPKEKIISQYHKKLIEIAKK